MRPTLGFRPRSSSFIGTLALLGICFWGDGRRSMAAAPESPATKSVVDLSQLSDEFDDAKSLRGWLREFEVEKTGADQLERIDFGRTRPGWATLVPHASSWYRDYRGVLVHRLVRGDFVATTHLRTTNRSSNGPPRRPFSLAGIMVRSPRNVTPRTWRPGGENYLFLSHGTADQPGQYQFEVKTTVNSDSRLAIVPADQPEAVIRVVRVGSLFLLFRKSAEEAPWILHQRYSRPDFPEELQVGMTVYTDWPTVERTAPPEHNTRVLRGGQPDLIASFDYFRFTRPELPEELRRQAATNPDAISDLVWLRLFAAP
jgi:hypothetical protein